jgi:hypothetical protein
MRRRKSFPQLVAGKETALIVILPPGVKFQLRRIRVITAMGFSTAPPHFPEQFEFSDYFRPGLRFAEKLSH